MFPLPVKERIHRGLGLFSSWAVSGGSIFESG